MFVSLHGLNEERQQGLEAFAANPVRRLPDHNQRIADRIIIKSARGSLSAPGGLFATQHPHGMLAMKTGHCLELIQDARFLAPLAFRVSLSDRYHQFISRRHRDPPHPRLRFRISTGSKSDEAPRRRRATVDAATTLAHHCVIAALVPAVFARGPAPPFAR